MPGLPRFWPQHPYLSGSDTIGAVERCGGWRMLMAMTTLTSLR